MGGEPVIVLARFLYYASVAVLFGASLFPFYALRDRAAEKRLLLPRTTGILLASTGLGSAIAWLLAFAVALGGPGGLTSTLGTLLLDSSLGGAWIVRLSLLSVLLVAAVSGRTLLTATAAFFTLFSEGWSGHGAAAGFVGPSLHAVHAVSAAAWLGGLLVVARTVSAARRRKADRHLAEQVLLRFSRVGIVAVLLLAATGSGMTWLMLGGVPRLSSSYDRILLLKIALFLSMVALAAANRFLLVPRLAALAPDPALRTLSATVLLEQVLGMGVLLDVAALGLMDPHG